MINTTNGDQGQLRKTTEAVRQGLSRAILDLRARMRWGQEDLAREITKRAARMGVEINPNQVCVSRWERCKKAPSLRHRAVLARIAEKNQQTEHLAEFFRVPISAWRLVGYVDHRDQSEE